jgi:DmsE family decaheme c-type cytochrome
MTLRARLGWTAALSVLLGLAVVVGAEEPAAPAAEFAGAESCGLCHPDQAESHGKTAHGRALADAGRPEAERGCEACHGAGAAHVEAGGGVGVGGLESFARSRPAAARSARCLGCHAGQASRFEFRTSDHGLSNVACTDCHGEHRSHRAEHLLESPLPRLCYGCHLEVRAQFALPEHHKVDEGVVSCLDCHEAHGRRALAPLRASESRACLRCHGDIEGPFVFEHAALVTEGCVRCHEPHGSVNRHLLVRQQVAQLCYECHAVTPANHLQPSFRDCTRCHVSIHGSNVDPRFLEP